MKLSGKTASCALRSGRLIGSLVCWVVFSFWGFQALQKFLSRPVSSSITVINGDDGLSNLIFPAITICAENLKYHLIAILRRENDKRCLSTRCSFGYSDCLSACIEFGSRSKTTTTTTTTTTENINAWGNLFDYDYGNDQEETIRPIDTVKEFLNITKVDVSEMIRSFSYGTEIIIEKGILLEEHRKEYLNDIWISTFEPTWGLCYTFDPVKQNITLLPSRKGIWPQKIYMEFEVRILTFN